MPLPILLLARHAALLAPVQQTPTPMTATAPATTTISGAFDVKMTPQTSASEAARWAA